MYDLFLKLLGVPVEQVSRITDSRLRFRGDVDFMWIVCAAVLLGVMVFLMYRKAAPDLSPVKKYVLATLRTVFLLLILLLLMRPVWAFVIESTVRRELVVLVDSSTSMKIEDPRSDTDVLKRVALARGLIDPAKGLNQTLNQTPGLEKVSRLDLVKTVLKSDKFDLMPRLAKDHNIDTFAFDSTLIPIPAASFRLHAAGEEPTTQPTAPSQAAWVDKLAAPGQQTAAGDALRAVVARKRGQPMAGVFMITDGANNSGSDPRAAAALAKDARIPLYIYGVGITSPKNLTVGNIFAPEISFVKDDVPVTVRVKSQGVPSARVILKLVDAAGQEEKVDEKEVNFDQDSEPAVALKFTPKVKGDFNLKAVIEPSDPAITELTKDDNESAQGLKVIDSKIKVLLVDQAPRWEFKYLTAQLMRDRRVDVKVILLEGSTGLARTKDSPYLEKFPENKKDLFKYDLIILGDVDSRVFSTGQLEAIEEFVTKFGGGLAVVAGKKNNPWSYRKTPIEKMLPVELEAGGNVVATGPGGEEANDKPVRLELTAAGKRAPMLRLAADDATSERLWAKLPPIFWVAPVSRAKPAAEVLLVDPTPTRSTRYGKMPVVAAQQYGMGQVMFIGTDNTWRWRKNKGDEQYVTLWGQVIQRLALPHLLGASKRTQLTLDKKEYVTNEKVNLYARLYTESYAPISQDKVKAFITETGPDDPRAREVTLRPLPDQPGMYRAEFNAPEKAAPYKLFVELDKSTLTDLPVNEPKMEPGENALNKEMLESLAKSTGGKFVREEDLYSLPDQIKAETPKVKTNLEVEFWTSPLYYGLMVLVVAAEWIMRKMVQLK
jgi:uncharacterized membrane protein